MHQVIQNIRNGKLSVKEIPDPIVNSGHVLIANAFSVISAGVDNKFGLPNAEVVERLKEELGQDRVYLTSEEGTIEVIANGSRMWIKAER